MPYALFLLFILVTACPHPAEGHTPTPPDHTPPAEDAAPRLHALTISGAPALPRDFEHFPYADPDAPKGGLLRQHAIGSFDNVNPFSTKGQLPAGYSLLYDSLTTGSLDEPGTEYCLIADGIRIAPDRSWVEFTINPAARFHDGTPITAHDVAFSFKATLNNLGSILQKFFADITGITVCEDRRIRFDLAPTASAELPLHLGRMPIYPRHIWASRDMQKTGLEAVVGSGPYRIASFTPGKDITYERVRDYWAADLPVCRGHYNFDTIRYDYYRDTTVALEAFKAGLYDVREEHSAKAWDTLYVGRLFDDGTIVKESFEHRRPLGMQGFFFNTRRPVFHDIRTRKALVLAFDYEWTNRQFFRGAYQRTTSYFSNSDLAASGLPTPEELALLAPFRDVLPPEVFTRAHAFPVSDGSGFNRANLIEAARLLDEAGWRLVDGQRVDAHGNRLRFELLLDAPSMRRVALPFAANLAKLGVAMHIMMPDTAVFLRKARSFDYDMVASAYGTGHTPGGELRLSWHSDSYALEGSRNIPGVAQPAVDSLVETIVTARDRATLRTACRALDRVLLQQEYVIPLGASAAFRIAYRSHLCRPQRSPGNTVGLTTWWSRTAEEAQAR
jgi:microcin C transport system substrate-binding protein